MPNLQYLTGYYNAIKLKRCIVPRILSAWQDASADMDPAIFKIVLAVIVACLRDLPSVRFPPVQTDAGINVLIKSKILS